MELKKLDTHLTVSGQVTAADLQQLAASGIKTLICNRPDGEEAGQPGFQDIARAAEALEMDFHYMPVLSGQVTDEDAEKFGQLLENAGGPVHAYCRSGMRCTTLWALHQSRSRPLEEILRAAQGAGYDMSGVVARCAGR